MLSLTARVHYAVISLGRASLGVASGESLLETDGKTFGTRRRILSYSR